MKMLHRLLCAAVLLLAGAIPAAAQRGPVYCNVTDITSEQLSNGVRVTIVADGQMDAHLDFDTLIAEGAFVRRRHEDGYVTGEFTERFRRLPIHIWNAKSRLGSGFVPIDRYPVSHVEISIPDWAREGVGIEVDIVNYLGLVVGEGDNRQHRFTWFETSGEGGDTFVVTWTSDRFPPPPPSVTPEDLPTELEVAPSGSGYRVHAVNAKLQDVAGAISQASGLPVITSPDSDLRVSLFLDNVSAEQALRALATGCGLCAVPCEEGGWVMAAGARAGGYGAVLARALPLRHLRAQDALDLLPNFLLQHVKTDDDTNSLVVSGPEWLVDRVESDLRKLDLPPRQVALDVTAVEYTDAQALVRDLDWGYFAGGFSAAFAALTGDFSVLWTKGLPRGIDAIVRGLDVQSHSYLHSSTSVRVLNGHTARIFAGQERHITIERTEEEGLAQLESVDIGTSLWLQPWVGRGDEVVLHLKMNIDNLIGTDARSGLPVVARRNGEAVVRVRDGDTILIAGLEVEDDTREVRSLPLLGELPTVGRLFTAVDRSRSQTRLAVFITPHLLQWEDAPEERLTDG